MLPVWYQPFFVIWYGVPVGTSKAKCNTNNYTHLMLHTVGSIFCYELVSFWRIKRTSIIYIFFFYKLVLFCRSTARLTSSTVSVSDILRKVETVTYTVYLFSCIVVRQVHGTYFQVVKDVHYLNFPSIEESINICANDEEKDLSLMCKWGNNLANYLHVLIYFQLYERGEGKYLKETSWLERERSII